MKSLLIFKPWRVSSSRYVVAFGPRNIEKNLNFSHSLGTLFEEENAHRH